MIAFLNITGTWRLTSPNVGYGHLDEQLFPKNPSSHAKYFLKSNEFKIILKMPYEID